MRHYLVVAHRTLGGAHLVEHVRLLNQQGPCSFHLLVPIHHPPSHPWTEGEVTEEAQDRLLEGIERFRDAGIECTGEVGDSNPVFAIGELLRRESFDEIILSTLPPGPSRWLHMDVPHRVQREYPLPLTHLVATREHATGS